MNKNKHKTINESPDSVESTGQYYTHNGSYPFVIFKGFPHEILIGNDGERHDSFEERIRLGDLDISPELYHSISTKKIKLGYNTSYEVCGRCWVNGQGNTISIWSYDINNYKRVGEKILPIVKALQNNGVNIDIETLDFDDWEGNLDSIFPFTWLLNGIADIYKKEALQIKEKNGKYIIFCKNGKTLICDRGGHIFEQNNKQKNINKKMSKKNTIRLTESDLKRVISESVKNVLHEAQLGRGTETVAGSSWSGDEYGGITHNWSRTRENPYRSDAALMLANRFEKVLGNDFKVEVHVNPIKKEGYDENTGQEIETSSNHGNYIDFEVYGAGNTNLDDILYVLNTAKKVFNNRDIKVYMIDEDEGINISVECSDIINKEPRTTMIPKRGGKAEKGKDGIYRTPFTSSNFKGSEYSSSYEN